MRRILFRRAAAEILGTRLTKAYYAGRDLLPVLKTENLSRIVLLSKRPLCISLNRESAGI